MAENVWVMNQGLSPCKVGRSLSFSILFQYDMILVFANIVSELDWI